jgi:hypothetical protein
MYSYYLFGQSISSSGYDIFGTFNSAVIGYYPLKIGNPDASWEKATIADIGFDAGFLANNFNLTFDWYSKKAYDLLYNAPQPGTAGAGDAPYINVASMKNTGIEMELSYQKKWNNLGLIADIVFTTCNNQITNIAEGAEYFGSGNSRIGNLVRNEEEHPISSFYGYQVAGLFKNAAEVDNSPSQDGAAPGFFRFANNDTTSSWGWQYIGPDDKIFIGDPNPGFTYGINIMLTWKNFDLTVFIYGSQGNDIFNYNKWYTDFWSSFQGQKSKGLLYKSWTETNKNAIIPRASNTSNSSTNMQVCSYYIEDGSYLRMKSLQLGYTLPESIVSKVKMKSLRVYLQAVNLFTITRYSGLDPELGGSDLAFGIDYGNYPSAKQFIFGLNLTL